MQEFKRSDRIAAELEAGGYEVTRGIAKTGLVGILRNGAGPAVMIRADMDGLPVQEKSGLAYASRARQVHLDGVDMPVMHACGHDMHITTLIGVARQLKARKAAPHLGRDPIVIASQIVVALQTIVTREVSPLEPAIITVGSFHSGTASNVISAPEEHRAGRDQHGASRRIAGRLAA